MRDFVKSSSSLMLALSLFGLKQIENLIAPRNRDGTRSRAAIAMNSITNVTVEQFGETLRGTFRAVDNMQRGLIGVGFSFYPPYWSATRPSDRTHPAPERSEASIRNHEVLAAEVLIGSHSSQ